MTGGARQLVLDLPHRPALGDADFMISACNRDAVSLIESWPAWPSHGLVLCGPAGSGKTHLAHVWQQIAGSAMIAAEVLTDQAVPALAAAPGSVVEDIDRAIGSERALFHLLNLAREQSRHVLLTARMPPGEWAISLPDLRSRLTALPHVHIGEPDESLLRAVLVKLLADRQLPATPHAIDYLARHMERSMAMALALAEELDRMAWERPREISREVARQALARLSGAGAAKGEEAG
jgi:chromosomal replication initiation ATPase DnaA